MPTLYKGGEIAASGSRKLQRGDILVDGDRIIGVEAGLVPPEGTELVDVSGKILVPGLFDIHVHLREPGYEQKETVATGLAAALNGGVTGVLAMPNTDPAIDSGGMVRYVLNLAREVVGPKLHTTGCITRGRLGESLAEIADMQKNGAVMITDDGDAVEDPQLMRRALEYAKGFDLIVGCHCEIKALQVGGAMNEGPVSYRRGLPGIPAVSEEMCIDRDLALAQWVGARVHVQHVSSARGAEIIRRYKDAGVQVTAEVTPHHLIFSDEDVAGYDTRYKMNPPLRRPEDREALLTALKEGVIDCIATDHAPHTSSEKNRDFCAAPFGITGLETALPSLYTEFIAKERFGWDVLVRSFSDNPRRLLKLAPVELVPGGAAEFLVFDPKAATTVDRSFTRSKSLNTPYYGATLKGSVERVVIDGAVLLDRLAGAHARA